MVNKDIIDVEAKFMRDESGFVYFYNEEDRSDMDNPVDVFAKETIQRIEKTKEEN